MYDINTLDFNARRGWSMKMSKVIISGLINGLLVLFGAYMAVASSLDENSGFSDIGQITWSIIIVTGFVAALKDWHAAKSQPE